MANLRSGFKVEGQPLSAEALDDLAELDPEQVEGQDRVVAAIAKRARIVVQAGLVAQLDLEDLSAFELTALAMARRQDQDRRMNLLAVSIAAANRTENLSALVPDDVGVDVPKIKFLADFERRAWERLTGGV